MEIRGLCYLSGCFSPGGMIMKYLLTMFALALSAAAQTPNFDAVQIKTMVPYKQ
jgi:hypothetical protein